MGSQCPKGPSARLYASFITKRGEMATIKKNILNRKGSNKGWGSEEEFADFQRMREEAVQILMDQRGRRVEHIWQNQRSLGESLDDAETALEKGIRNSQQAAANQQAALSKLKGAKADAAKLALQTSEFVMDVCGRDEGSETEEQ